MQAKKELSANLKPEIFSTINWDKVKEVSGGHDFSIIIAPNYSGEKKIIFLSSRNGTVNYKWFGTSERTGIGSAANFTLSLYNGNQELSKQVLIQNGVAINNNSFNMLRSNLNGETLPEVVVWSSYGANGWGGGASGFYWTSMGWFFQSLQNFYMLDTQLASGEGGGGGDNTVEQNIYVANEVELHIHDNLKDSTNSPCVAATLGSLNNLATNTTLPALITSIFGSASPLNITVKSAFIAAAPGKDYVVGFVPVNLFPSGDFQITLNNHFGDATNLSLAVTLMHEALHCQLMFRLGEAYTTSDPTVKMQIAAEYGSIFTKEITAFDITLLNISIENTAQHNVFAEQYIQTIGAALYQFAQSNNITASQEYCTKLAWGGLEDSEAFKLKSANEKRLIKEAIFAELDPNSTTSTVAGFVYNQEETQHKGVPCQ